MTRPLYQLHKWLSVVGGLAALAWFVSGAVMATPPRWRTLSPSAATGTQVDERVTDAPAFTEATVPVRDAIDAVRRVTAASAQVRGVRLRRLPGLLAYEVATSAGTRLVDARSGEIVALTSPLATAIAQVALGTTAPAGPVTVERGPSDDYRGALPAFRVPLDDGKGTIVFVSGPPIDLRYTDRLRRLSQSITDWHDLLPLQKLLPASVVRLLFFVMAIVGVLLCVFGLLILGAQLQRWRRIRAVRSV